MMPPTQSNLIPIATLTQSNNSITYWYEAPFWKRKKVKLLSNHMRVTSEL